MQAGVVPTPKASPAARTPQLINRPNTSSDALATSWTVTQYSEFVKALIGRRHVKCQVMALGASKFEAKLASGLQSKVGRHSLLIDRQ